MKLFKNLKKKQEKRKFNKVHIFKRDEFRSLEIDVDKKIYKINGVDFGKYCKSYSLHLRKDEGKPVLIDFRATGDCAFGLNLDAYTMTVEEFDALLNDTLLEELRKLREQIKDA